MSKETAPRKPKAGQIGWDSYAELQPTINYGWLCNGTINEATPAEAQRIAYWLLRFAAWAEHQKEGKKK